MRAPVLAEAVQAHVWHVEDDFRGLRGKARLASRCRALLRDHEPDLVYLSHDLNVAAQVATSMRALASVPIFVHSHAREFPWQPRWKRGLLQFLVRRCTDVRVAVSVDAARAMWGPHPEPWIEHLAAVDFDELWATSTSPPPSPGTGFRYACIGRLVEQKNQRLALEAIARLRQRGIDCSLLLLGDGPDRQSLRHLAHCLGLDDRIHLPGNVENVGAWMHHAIDALLVPSRSEGQGRVVAEAQAFGLPIVVGPAVPDTAFIDANANVVRVANLEIADWVAAMEKVVSIGTPKRVNLAAGAHSRLSMRHAASTFVDMLHAGLAGLGTRVRRPATRTGISA